MSEPNSAPLELIAHLAAGGRKPRIRVRGSSMLPLLEPGMIIELEPFARPIRLGTIMVFRGPAATLIAHRVIARSKTGCTTAGDAYPQRLEHLRDREIVGCVGRIWRDSKAQELERVDGSLFHLRGRLYVAVRPLRALLKRAQALWQTLGMNARSAINTEHAALWAALRSLATNSRNEFLQALQGCEPHRLAAVIRRQHCSGLIAVALEGDGPAAGVPAELLARLQKTRIATAFQIRRLRAELEFVIPILQEAQVRFILLKGAARIVADPKSVAQQYSGDIDILVHPDDRELTLQTLQGAGYESNADRKLIAKMRRFHHHEAPLQRSGGIPLEVHWQLTIPGSTSQVLDYAALDAHSNVSTGHFTAPVLNRVASALHLAYHARAGVPFRDTYLLGQILAQFSTAERAEFTRLIQNERRDAVRLASAVWRAEELFALPHSIASPRVERYAAWVLTREDLEPRLRERASFIDGFFARNFWPEYGFQNVIQRGPAIAARLLCSPLILSIFARTQRQRLGTGV